MAYFLRPVLQDIFDGIRTYGHATLIIIFVVGIPLAILNEVESKYIWGRVIKNKNIDLLGVSIGFMIGLMILYHYPLLNHP